MFLPFVNNYLPDHDEVDLYSILAYQAEQQPDKVYLYRADGNITYRQMCKIASGLGQSLQTRLDGARQPVIAVSLGCNTAVLQLVWACLASGICLVFLPHIADPDQIASLLAHIEAELLVTDQPTLQEQPWAISFDTLQQSFSEDVVVMPRVIAQLDGPAFVFQTSGTTGAAKWIQVTHEQYLKAIVGMQHAGCLEHASNQMVYLTPPLSHSYGLSSMLEYSFVGSSLILPEAGSVLGAVGELMDDRFACLITAVEGVPHFYAQMARLIKRIRLPNLQHIGFGGGAIDLEAVRQIRSNYPDLSYSVRYGLTETPSVVSHKLFKPPYTADWQSSGEVLPIYSLRIADEDGNSVPIGQPGQICLKGDSLAWPYFGETADSDYFPTGDNGFIHADTSELHILGRQSSFIKVQGYRLSPEYIESIIGTFAGVLECRVSGSDAGIQAEVVPADETVLPQALQAFLAEKLPAYAIPETITFVPAIPRTPSGKIKRH